MSTCPTYRIWTRDTCPSPLTTLPLGAKRRYPQARYEESPHKTFFIHDTALFNNVWLSHSTIDDNTLRSRLGCKQTRWRQNRVRADALAEVLYRVKEAISTPDKLRNYNRHVTDMVEAMYASYDNVDAPPVWHDDVCVGVSVSPNSMSRLQSLCLDSKSRVWGIIMSHGTVRAVLLFFLWRISFYTN